MEAPLCRPTLVWAEMIRCQSKHALASCSCASLCLAEASLLHCGGKQLQTLPFEHSFHLGCKAERSCDF